MAKNFYEKPGCEVLDVGSLSYVLMGSNEGYPVDPFDPFNESESE